KIKFHRQFVAVPGLCALIVREPAWIGREKACGDILLGNRINLARINDCVEGLVWIALKKATRSHATRSAIRVIRVIVILAAQETGEQWVRPIWISAKVPARVRKISVQFVGSVDTIAASGRLRGQALALIPDKEKRLSFLHRPAEGTPILIALQPVARQPVNL